MTATQEKAKRPRRVFSAQEKAEAVLSVWSSRRKPAGVCKSLGIAWGVLNFWEKSALLGIQKALGQETPVEKAGLPMGGRLERLLNVPAAEKAEAKGE